MVDTNVMWVFEFVKNHRFLSELAVFKIFENRDYVSKLFFG
jgi:hypothetical protein